MLVTPYQQSEYKHRGRWVAARLVRRRAVRHGKRDTGPAEDGSGELRRAAATTSNRN
jgi:hypothetical protein